MFAGPFANRNFTAVFGDRTSFRAKGCAIGRLKSQFYFSFWRSNLISCERVCRTLCKSQFYFSSWRSNLISRERVALGQAQIKIAILLVSDWKPSFRTKRFAGRFAHRNFTAVFGDRTPFRAKGLCNRTPEIAILPQFLEIEPHFVRKGSPDPLQIAILPQFLAIEPHFVRKGCVSCRLVGTAPRLQERNGKEGESKRAREQERMWRCEDVRMWGCEDVRMWRCEDVKMWGCEDLRMRGCEDAKIRRCEDVRMWRCEDAMRMWRCEDVKMRRCEDETMSRCEDDEKMWRCEDEKMKRCEDVRMWRWENVKMWGCEDVNMFDRPPLLEEPFAQTLSGKKEQWCATFIVSHYDLQFHLLNDCVLSYCNALDLPLGVNRESSIRIVGRKEKRQNERPVTFGCMT